MELLGLFLILFNVLTVKSTILGFDPGNFPTPIVFDDEPGNQRVMQPIKMRQISTTPNLPPTPVTTSDVPETKDERSLFGLESLLVPNRMSMLQLMVLFPV